MLRITTPKQHIVHRLKICAGHIHAIEQQVQNDTECLLIVHQVQAVESALMKIESMLIQEYLRRHATSPEQLVVAVKLVASSSLHLPTSKIDQ